MGRGPRGWHCYGKEGGIPLLSPICIPGEKRCLSREILPTFSPGAKGAEMGGGSPGVPKKGSGAGKERKASAQQGLLSLSLTEISAETNSR